MERKILVVEDSPTQAERIRLLLEAEGYQVDLAANGMEGLERVHAAPPDLIISDVIMPEMDGYELCQAVKTHEKTKRIPFVLLTERKTPLDILKGLERGADNFITKPFEDDYLLERVRRICEHLDFRKKGQLDVEVAIRASGREIVISPDKQQIVELLFASFEEICALNAQLAESKQRAETASRHKSDFLASMSHELRTPLNNILGFAELLKAEVYGPLTEKQARFVHHILDSGEHLLELINDLLDLSKVEAGRLDLRPEAFSLSDALTGALDQFRIQAHTKGVTLALQVAEAPGKLVADPLRFRQILYNLLSNAVKFTPAGGAITITARRGSHPAPKRYPPTRGDLVEITVSDTGIGIKAEDLGRLFQEYTQLDSSLAMPHQGTGLGLALTKRLVTLHGGSVIAASAGEGQGSTFTVTLPLWPPQTRGQVLVIEEDERLREKIVETLQNAGFGVEAAEDGETALAQAALVPPELVILDLCLSGLQGLEVLRRIRAEVSGRQPIIVLAKGEGESVQEALTQGANEFMVKPVSLGVLTDTVDRLLGRGQGVTNSLKAHVETPETGS